MSKDMNQAAQTFPTRSVSVKRLVSKAKIPTYGSAGAACFDFYACLAEDEVVVPPHSTVRVGTGLAFSVSHVVLMLQVVQGT